MIAGWDAGDWAQHFEQQDAPYGPAIPRERSRITNPTGQRPYVAGGNFSRQPLNTFQQLYREVRSQITAGIIDRSPDAYQVWAVSDNDDDIISPPVSALDLFDPIAPLNGVPFTLVIGNIQLRGCAYGELLISSMSSVVSSLVRFSSIDDPLLNGLGAKLYQLAHRYHGRPIKDCNFKLSSVASPVIITLHPLGRGGGGKPKKKRPSKKPPVKKRPVASRPRRVSQPHRPPSGLRLSKCATHLLTAFASPFNDNSRGVCLPTIPAMKTMKASADIRLVVTIGSNGFGCIQVTPCSVNNMPQFYYTTGLYTGTGVAGDPAPIQGASTLSVGWQRAMCSTLPFTAAQVATLTTTQNAQVYARCVCASLSVAYMGTELNRGGLVVCYGGDGERVCTAGYDIIAATDTNSGRVEGFERTPCVLTLTPTCRTELEFNASEQTTGASFEDGLYPFCMNVTSMPSLTSDTGSGGGTLYTDVQATYNVGAPVGVVYFSGVAGQTVLVKYTAHFEYTGRGTCGMGTMNAEDEDGLETCLQAMNIVNADLAGADRPCKPETLFKKLVHAATAGIKMAAKHAVPLLLDVAIAAVV
jgi:hypothetical protein